MFLTLLSSPPSPFTRTSCSSMRESTPKAILFPPDDTTSAVTNESGRAFFFLRGSPRTAPSQAKECGSPAAITHSLPSMVFISEGRTLHVRSIDAVGITRVCPCRHEHALKVATVRGERS